MGNESNYLLINPFILGQEKPIFKAESPLDAANKAYKSLSGNFSNNVPEFIFTLQKLKKKKQLGGGSNKDYSHFMVKEQRSKNNLKAVKFNIQEINFSNKDNSLLSEFKSDFKEIINDIKNNKKLKGGGYDDALFDDNDDDDIWMSDIYWDIKYKKASPYWSMYYAPYLYNNFVTRRYLSFPTFISTVNPYIYFINRKVEIPI